MMLLSLFDSEIGVYPNCGCFVLMVALDLFGSLGGDDAVDKQILSLGVVFELFVEVVIIGRF